MANQNNVVNSDGKIMLNLKEEGKIFQSIGSDDIETAINSNITKVYGRNTFCGSKIKKEKKGELSIILGFYPNNKIIKKSELVKFGIESEHSKNSWDLTDELISFLIDNRFIGKDDRISKLMRKKGNTKIILITINAGMTLNMIMPKLEAGYEYGIFGVKKIPKTNKSMIKFCTKKQPQRNNNNNNNR